MNLLPSAPIPEVRIRALRYRTASTGGDRGTPGRLPAIGKRAHRAGIGTWIASLLVAALLSACSVAPVAPERMSQAAPASVALAKEASAPKGQTTAPAAEPASARHPVSATAHPLHLPPLDKAGLDEIRVSDPLHIHTIDLTSPPDDLWQRIRNGFGMRNLSSPLVLDREIWYASRPKAFQEMVQRSRRYLYHIVEELNRRGMPTELALLPMVESAFNPMAYSRAQASGLWQFIPSTARTYNLKQNWWVDGRRDIIASTNAALDYLQYLYQEYGDWFLALAAYNWGENAVSRAIARNKALGLPTNYQSLKMPRETRYYVPKLQALKNIISNPKAFGINLDPIPNKPYFVTVEKKQDIDIRTAAELAEMPVEELIALNPAYKRPVLTAAQSKTLILPADHAEIFRNNLKHHHQPLNSWRTYRIKRGEPLRRVAARHGIPLARLRKVNGIGPYASVRPGQRILVPVKGSSAARDPLPGIYRTLVPYESYTQTIVYVVKRGDTLSAIARHHGVPLRALYHWNRIGRLLRIGQRIVMHVQASQNGPKIALGPQRARHRAKHDGSSPSGAERIRLVYTVKKGDTLSVIARHYKVSVGDLHRWNRLSKMLPIGRKIVVYPPAARTPAAHGHGAARRAGRGAGSPSQIARSRLVYTVKKGDTLSVIARRCKVSLRDLHRWNRLGRLLAIGQKLVVSPPAAHRAPVVAVRKTTHGAEQSDQSSLVAEQSQIDPPR